MVIGSAVIGSVGLVLAPVATSRRTAGTGWIHGIHLNLRLRQIPEQLASGFSAPQIATLATYALVALSILLLVVGGDARSRRAGALAAATAALTLGLPLALVHFGLDYVITRNVIFVAVPVTVLVAVGRF